MAMEAFSKAKDARSVTAVKCGKAMARSTSSTAFRPFGLNIRRRRAGRHLIGFLLYQLSNTMDLFMLNLSISPKKNPVPRMVKTVCPLEPQGSSSSKQIKVPEAAALDVKLEKAHKQLQKETMEQLEKARKADDDPHQNPKGCGCGW